MARKRSIVLAAAGLGAGLIVRQAWRRRAGIDLFGKVVLITGGAGGLGLGLAREFAAAGCRLAICGHDANELDQARQDLERQGAHVFATRCDVTNLAEVDGMVGAALDRYGAIDILVNSAGDAKGGSDPEMPLADFEQAMEVMFWGLLYPTRAVLPHMLERRCGRIVNITSWGGPLPYDCARSAAMGFSEGLRAEVANQGITVMTIAPEAISGAGQIVSAVSRGSNDLNGGARNGNGARRDSSTRSALFSALGILGRAAARRYLHAGR